MNIESFVSFPCTTKPVQVKQCLHLRLNIVILHILSSGEPILSLLKSEVNLTRSLSALRKRKQQLPNILLPSL